MKKLEMSRQQFDLHLQAYRAETERRERRLERKEHKLLREMKLYKTILVKSLAALTSEQLLNQDSEAQYHEESEEQYYSALTAFNSN